MRLAVYKWSANGWPILGEVTAQKALRLPDCVARVLHQLVSARRCGTVDGGGCSSALPPLIPKLSWSSWTLGPNGCRAGTGCRPFARGAPPWSNAVSPTSCSMSVKATQHGVVRFPCSVAGGFERPPLPRAGGAWCSGACLQQAYHPVRHPLSSKIAPPPPSAC